MAYQIKITFDATKVQAPAHPVAPISPVYVPTNAAADMEVFDDTYYDTNVYEMDYGTEFEDFLASQVTHPGLVAAMRKARNDGEYTMTTDDTMMEIMVEELNTTMAETGFSFEWIPGNAE